MRLFGKQQQSEQARKDAALRQKLAGHEVKPPSYLWDAIEEKLPEGKRRRGTLLYYILPLAACLIAAIVFVSIDGGKQSLAKKPMTEKHVSSVADNTKQEIVSTEKSAPAFSASTHHEPSIALESKEDSYSGSGHKQKKNHTYGSHTVVSYDEGFTPKLPVPSGLDKQVTPPQNAIKEIAPVEKNTPAEETQNNVTRPEEKVADNTGKKEENAKAPDGNKPLVNTAKKDSRWMLGARASTGYSYRFLGKNSLDVLNTQGNPTRTIGQNGDTTGLFIHEYGGTGTSVSFLARYALTKKLSLISGIDYYRGTINSVMRISRFTYTDTNYYTHDGEYLENTALGQVDNKSFAGTQDINSLPQPIYVYNERLTPIRYYFRSFQVPLLLRADFTGKHVGFFAEGGPTLRLLQSYFTKVYFDSAGTWNRVALTSTYSTFQVGAQMHTGLSIPVSTKFLIEGGPSFNTMITPLLKEGTRTYLYQLGGSLTAWYKF